MSIISNLRMRSMFGRRPNPDEDVELNPTPMGMRGFIPGTVLEQPLQFGGVFETPKPDDLHRSESLGLYNSYKDRLNPDVTGPSNDVLDLERYTNRQLKEKTVNANIAQNERRITNDETRLKQADERIDNAGWTVGMIPDPNNPSKQISVRINSKDGRVEPIKMNGNTVDNISKPGSNKSSLVQPSNLKFIRDSAKQSLDAISEFLDDKDNLTNAGLNVSGGSALLNRVPFTQQRGQSNTLNRLKADQIISLIGEMKSQSKNGATGFGALNMKELGVLENAASQLDSFTDEASFKKELKRIKDRLKMILEDETPSKNESITKSGVNSSNPPKAPEGYEYVRRPDNKGWTAVKKVGK